MTYLLASNLSEIKLIEAVHSHHKHLKDVLVMSKSVNFVIFKSYLQCEIKSNIRAAWFLGFLSRLTA